MARRPQLYTTILAIMVAGCSYLRGFEQRLSTDDQIASEYGIVAVSKPAFLPLKDIEAALDTDVQSVTFDAALQQAALFQSAGYRRREVIQQAGVRASADLLKAQQLAIAAAAGIPPPEGSTTPPELPAAPTLLTPTDFGAGASGATPNVALGFRRRIQTAFGDVLLAKLGAAQLNVLKKQQSEWDIRLAFSNFAVIPGAKTQLDSAAELRTLWSVDRALECPGDPAEEKRPPPDPKKFEDLLRVIPLFPTYDAVGELNDAGALDRTLFFLTALAQYGPAQAQGDYQRLVNDVRRLVSATQRVTLIGSALVGNAVHYRITGERTARPFEELRPRGKTKLEPLTMPMVTIVLLKKAAFKPLDATEATAVRDRNCKITLKTNLLMAVAGGGIVRGGTSFLLAR